MDDARSGNRRGRSGSASALRRLILDILSVKADLIVAHSMTKGKHHERIPGPGPHEGGLLPEADAFARPTALSGHLPGAFAVESRPPLLVSRTERVRGSAQFTLSRTLADAARCLRVTDDPELPGGETHSGVRNSARSRDQSSAASCTPRPPRSNRAHASFWTPLDAWR